MDMKNIKPVFLMIKKERRQNYIILLIDIRIRKDLRKDLKNMAKTKLNEIERNIYDIKNKDEYEYKIKKGLTPEIIKEISKQKQDPEWMR